MKAWYLSFFFFLICFQNAFAVEDYFFFSPSLIEAHLSGYNLEEKAAIAKDLAVVRSVCFSGKEVRSVAPVYLATAGAPGSRKSTILERYLAAHPEYSHVPYLDPDCRALKFMAHTYYACSLSSLAIAQHAEYPVVQKAAYDKWRGASNYIALTLIEEAFHERFSLVHGTTMTGGHVQKLFEKLKEAGYSIHLLLCSCEDVLRSESITYRNKEQCFYQSTPEDVLAKGKFFAQKMECYFRYADHLHLYWSDGLFDQERLAATYKDDVLTIHDDEAYRYFISKYEKDRQKFKEEGVIIPSWNSLF